MFIINPYWFSLSQSLGLGLNYGYQFDGTKSIDFGNVLDNDGTQAFSISFRTKNIANSEWVFTKQSKRYEGLEINSDGNRKIGFSLGRTSTDRIACTSVDAIPLNQWNHWVITYDGSKTVAGVEMYMNDVLQSKTTVRDTFTGSSSNSGNFNMGSLVWSVNNWLDCRLDDVQYYDFVLNSSQVNSVYNNGYVTPPTAGPIHHWKMGEDDTFSTNWTVNDSVGSLNGTSSNMVEDDRKLGVAYSMAFDGVDEYIDFGNLDLFPQNSPFSISFWARDTGGRQGYISKTNGIYNGFVLFQNFSNMRFHIGSSEFSNRIQVSSSWTVPNNTWNHFIATFDGVDANGVTLYKNAVSGQAVNGNDLTTDVSNTSSMKFGTTDVLGSLVGNMMYVSIFNTELSASDVTSLYNSGVPVDPRDVSLNPSFFAPLGGPNDTFNGADWTIIDEINGNNGTSVNMEEADKTSETP